MARRITSAICLMAALTDEGLARRRATTTGEAKGNWRISRRRQHPVVPTWLIQRGYRFGTVAADCAEAPHVHVVGHGGAATFWQDPVRLVQTVGYNARDLHEVARIVQEHEANFRERWRDFCGQS